MTETARTPQTFEGLCAEVHALYQREIRRQGREERHNDDYFSLPEHVKELDRVFVRWHIERLDAALASQQAEIDRLDRELTEMARTFGGQAARIDRYEIELRAAREVVAEQAEDEGLWFVARTAPEAYLQQELRRLHAAIEGDRLTTSEDK